MKNRVRNRVACKKRLWARLVLFCPAFLSSKQQSFPDQTTEGVSQKAQTTAITVFFSKKALTVCYMCAIITTVALFGGVSEWFKELVLKTSDSQEPRVRIPSPPPFRQRANMRIN